MKLWEYTGKRIKVTCIDGKIIEGNCDCYTQALDNEPEIASISIDKGSYGIELYENEIKSIEVI
ncbi:MULTISPECIES: hypothetical protein [Clostridium]|uniref:hypothetical protein n=1 Tax=Clostridium TaxID=1485 RepID=UPI00069CF958|nr:MULTISPECIES: hypothetical protein [Clostridium]KOF56625.1 hypothetical protein AGR56_07785 [Clostridium sp. DMHC 10]MCD2348463.1 hypothetical protein [Clostridium guangxiense]